MQRIVVPFPIEEVGQCHHQLQATVPVDVAQRRRAQHVWIDLDLTVFQHRAVILPPILVPEVVVHVHAVATSRPPRLLLVLVLFVVRRVHFRSFEHPVLVLVDLADLVHLSFVVQLVEHLEGLCSLFRQLVFARFHLDLCLQQRPGLPVHDRFPFATCFLVQGLRDVLLAQQSCTCVAGVRVATSDVGILSVHVVLPESHVPAFLDLQRGQAEAAILHAFAVVLERQHVSFVGGEEDVQHAVFVDIVQQRRGVHVAGVFCRPSGQLFARGSADHFQVPMEGRHDDALAPVSEEIRDQRGGVHAGTRRFHPPHFHAGRTRFRGRSTRPPPLWIRLGRRFPSCQETGPKEGRRPPLLPAHPRDHARSRDDGGSSSSLVPRIDILERDLDPAIDTSPGEPSRSRPGWDGKRMGTRPVSHRVRSPDDRGSTPFSEREVRLEVPVSWGYARLRESNRGRDETPTPKQSRWQVRPTE
eukprot:scaffold1141_cov333-Pavlova_lutheri.AAC.25